MLTANGVQSTLPYNGGCCFFFLQGCFFRMVAFAGERVLELEAPIRNDGTKATLTGWGRTQDEVEGGRRRLEPAMVRECFEYLFSKVNNPA